MARSRCWQWPLALGDRTHAANTTQMCLNAVQVSSELACRVCETYPFGPFLPRVRDQSPLSSHQPCSLRLRTLFLSRHGSLAGACRRSCLSLGAGLRPWHGAPSPSSEPVSTSSSAPLLRPCGRIAFASKGDRANSFASQIHMQLWLQQNRATRSGV